MTDLPPLPPSKALLGGRTLLLLPSLVGMIGLNEAIVLQQVRYRLGDDLRPHVRDGRRWVRDPLERWQERDFPFWEIDTLRRAFQSLEARGLLRSEQFDKQLRDRTKWYTIDFDALALREREYRAIRAGTPPPALRRRASRPRVEGPGASPAVGRGGEPLPPLPASDLLVDEPPLLIIVDLAVAIGLDEALILQQIRYWLADERKPPVRDGRRWVCPREIGCFDPLAFRSGKTLARALRSLEHSGLLLASDRFNRLPGDRTKWYTINFESVAAITVGQIPDGHRAETGIAPKGQNAGVERDKMPVSSGTESKVPAARLAHIVTDKVPVSSRTECAAQSPNLHDSLRDSETDRETKSAIQQQQEGDSSVVVADPDNTLMLAEAALRERGLTAAVARDLAQRCRDLVDRQIEIYDWLRARDPDDHRLTPGRLRRMIEEDWAPPPDFLPAAVHQEREIAALAKDRAREDAEKVRRDRELAQQAEFHAQLDRLGLRVDDQALWRGLVVQPPALPRFLGEALFCPPPPGTRTAGLVFADAAARDRAATLPRDVAERLRDRLATRLRLGAIDIVHFIHAELLEQLTGERHLGSR